MPDFKDQNFELLQQSIWEGIFTRCLAGTWVREDDLAKAKFKEREDAAHFVHGYLDYWKCFKPGTVDRVEVKSEPSTGFCAPTTVIIPLDILEADKLNWVVTDWECRDQGPNRTKPKPTKFSRSP
jgi:hypothetical protein